MPRIKIRSHKKRVTARPVRVAPIYDRQAIDIPINAVIAPIEVKDADGDRTMVVRSLRDDSLAWLHSHNRIDDAQFSAGRKMQALYERANIGTVRAVDTTNEPVDGGGSIPDLITDAVIDAVKQIAAIESVLGREGAAICRDFLAFGNSVVRCADIRGVPAGHQLGRAALGYRIREVLETLAVEFGFVSK